MSFAAIRQEIGSRLVQIDKRLLEVEARFAASTDREKDEAVGELEFLKQQKRDLEQRLARLDRNLDNDPRMAEGGSRDARTTVGKVDRAPVMLADATDSSRLHYSSRRGGKLDS